MSTPITERPARLAEHDATALVGLRVRVHDAAIETIDENGEIMIELPQLSELMAAAAVVRCLMPGRLHGHEIKAIRKIMGLTLAEMASRLDAKTAPETVSRWETDQPMGGYAEKVLRLLVCETLSPSAPGIEYAARRISDAGGGRARAALDRSVPGQPEEGLRGDRAGLSDGCLRLRVGERDQRHRGSARLPMVFSDRQTKRASS
jgi:DNA-binding transcriptional regulator YiaG